MDHDTRTVFLDAGNTLISMNYDWVAAELERAGLATGAVSLRRAEARVRPGISAYSARNPAAGGMALFCRYLGMIVAALPAAERPDEAGIAAVSRDAAARLKAPGRDHRLWSWVMPGVPEALERLAGLGLDLVVVSNSDGSVERAMVELGLAPHLRAVIDSQVVGYEKPDPRIFAHALAAVGAVPERTVHVGDMYFQDVVGAREAGIATVLLDPFGDWPDVDCVRCRDLTEVALRIEQAR